MWSVNGRSESLASKLLHFDQAEASFEVSDPSRMNHPALEPRQCATDGVGSDNPQHIEPAQRIEGFEPGGWRRDGGGHGSKDPNRFFKH
jgi:hypothetical protein